ncbi:hypothetical protein MNBD_ALPHA02-294 [hydrothermal vent metagenome]|uniref:BioF2-like acetyltransferase domain-containing protein n=1 Tax=hydrothermal vent metagenome TaxID=652676 RepID=A0A3B0RTX1_9ZZZZ
MSEIIIKWDDVSQRQWGKFLRKAARCSFQQAWAYGAVIGQGRQEVARFIAYDGGEAVAMGQVVTRRYVYFLKFNLLLKGPVWLKEVDEEQKKQILTEVSNRYPLKNFNLFAFSPDEPASEVSEKSLYENMGYRQIVTGNSTILINLELSEDKLWQNLYSKNRTHIRKAEKNDFDVIYGDHSHLHIDWLLEQESKQQQKNKYQGVPVGLVKGYGQYSSGNQGVYSSFAVEKGAETPMAGVLFLCHGRCATYHIGWNGPRGRKSRALNLLLWKMILKLKQDGIRMVDLGGINTEEGADIARYKLSFSNEVTRLCGTYM